MKENVIVGRLIPAGTGSVVRRFRALAAQRDQELQAERERRLEIEAAEKSATDHDDVVVAEAS